MSDYISTRSTDYNILLNNNILNRPRLIRQIGEHHWEPAFQYAIHFGRPVIAEAYYGPNNGYATVFIALPNGKKVTQKNIPTRICKYTKKIRLPKCIENLCVYIN